MYRRVFWLKDIKSIGTLIRKFRVGEVTQLVVFPKKMCCGCDCGVFKSGAVKLWTTSVKRESQIYLEVISILPVFYSFFQAKNVAHLYTSLFSVTNINNNIKTT